MIARIASLTAVALATLVLALTLTTVPALLALGGAALAFAAVIAGTALREPAAVPVRAQRRR